MPLPQFDESDSWAALVAALGIDPTAQPDADALKKRLDTMAALFKSPQFTPSIPAAPFSRMALVEVLTTAEESGAGDFDFTGPTLVVGFLPVVREVAYNAFAASRPPALEDFFVRFVLDRDTLVITQSSNDTKDAAGNPLDEWIDLAALNNSNGAGRLFMLLLTGATPKFTFKVRSKFGTTAPASSGIPHDVQVSLNAFFIPLYKYGPR